MNQKNVFGEKLESCCLDPVTGFFRDGFCNTSAYDRGSHTVCALVTNEFLEFSKSRGNELSTPVPEFEFPGLVDGQSWCLCANRWLEAHSHRRAPKVFLKKTNIRALDTVPLEILLPYAIDVH